MKNDPEMKQKFRSIKQEKSIRDFVNMLKLETRNYNYKTDEKEMLMERFIPIEDFQGKEKVLSLGKIGF